MYNKITNPETGRQVSIYGKRGQMVLRKYLTIIQQTVGGGDSDETDAEHKAKFPPEEGFIDPETLTQKHPPDLENGQR